MREITYEKAINEAMIQEMERDPSVFVYGIGVDDHKRIFGTTNELVERFGKERCMDTPIAEDSMTGMGIGAAINGLRPIHIHIRVDFLLLAMNQLANIASSYCYSTNGKRGVPLVIRAIVGRGWGQGFQHSKTCHSLFSHIPGIKVILPTTPYDVKGMLISAIRDNNPVVVIEHRWLYWQKGEVPKEPYTLDIGKARVIKEGTDITLIATSWLNVEALKAAEILEKHGVSVEIVDVRSLAPLDTYTIVSSVSKTGRCIIADNDWVLYGAGAEIAATVYKYTFGVLQSPIQRIGFAHTPCPTARHLENEFYPNAVNIIHAIESEFGLDPIDLSGEEFYSHENRFKGPF